MSKFISVGKILNFHGIQGDAKVGYSKNQQDFFCSLNEVFVLVNREYIPLKIKSCRFNKTFAIVKFEGINSINDLMPYKNSLLFVPEEVIRESLEDDEFLIDELVGLGVFDADDKKLGFIIGVSNNGASDLLSVKTKSGKISLVPFVKAIVARVSIKDKKVVVNNIEGLIEE